MPVSIVTTYGSKTYENLLGAAGTQAAFMQYIPATRLLYDVTGKNYLSASLSSTALFREQLPIAALSSTSVTYNINSSNAISIYENANYYGSAPFGAGDENKNFATSFIFSHNSSSGDINNFAKFGYYNNVWNFTISYSKETNNFYLNGYSSDNYIVYRSKCSANPVTESKHFVINFSMGQPFMYVNGIKAKTLINELPSKVFFAPKSSRRIIAEFSDTGNNDNLVSAICFYNYNLTEEIINQHYQALFDVGKIENYSTRYGSILLSQNIPANQRIARNDDTSQDFFNTEIFGVGQSNGKMMLLNNDNFNLYGLTNEYNVYVTPGTFNELNQNAGVSLRSTTYGTSLMNKGIALSFVGNSGTGKYTAENALLYIENSTVGDFWITIDSSSSKMCIGSGSATILASTSASISKATSKTVNVLISGSTLFANFSDSSDSASYNFGSDIDTTDSIIHAFNRYYYDSNGYLLSVGNKELSASLSKVYLGQYPSSSVTEVGFNTTNLIKKTDGTIRYNSYIKLAGQAIIAMPVPDKQYNYLYISDSGNITYTLYVDSASSLIKNESRISIPTSSSSVYISASFSGYLNDNIHESYDDTWIDYISMFNFASFTQSSQSHPTEISSSSGLLSGPASKNIMFRGNNIGFLQSYGNILSFSYTDSDYQQIGEIDFLISITGSTTTAPQFLIDNGSSSSMTLTYNSTSNTYLLNFSGASVYVNNSLAVSGSTRIWPKENYFVQASFVSSIAPSTTFYMFSASNGSSSFAHSFKNISIFPTGLTNRAKRYGSLVGRRTVQVSDDTDKFLYVQNIPDSITIGSYNWQIFFSKEQ